MQRLLAIVWLTWKATFRFRLFPLLLGLLLVVVIGLPLVIRDDGTARGLVQILLTYTLGSIATLLGFATLWTACGTLARDVEECQMQMVAVKPVARWQIWLGKWLGLVSLNAVLLAVAGGAVFALIHWRAEKLPAAQKEILNRELLVGRASFKPSKPDIEARVAKEIQTRLGTKSLETAEMAAFRASVREQVAAQEQVVPPHLGRRWKIDLGAAKNSLHGQPMQLRVKFFSSEPYAATLGRTCNVLWQIGVPETPKIERIRGGMPPEAFHEFALAPDLFNEHGVLTIDCYNLEEQTALLVPFDDGIEVLYRESSFALNFARGLTVILLWLALLSALGLAAASCLSFPVAAFLSFTVLLVALSSGLLASVVEEGTILGVGEHGERAGRNWVDTISIPAAKGLLHLLNLALAFSPIEALSLGRSITWGTLGLACSQILLLLGGGLAAFGIVVFTRRELAAAQSSH